MAAAGRGPCAQPTGPLFTAVAMGMASLALAAGAHCILAGGGRWSLLPQRPCRPLAGRHCCAVCCVLPAEQARVEELRQVKEAQFWGRIQPAKRDLPAFWSVEAHGQPFNDERLAQGTTNYYKASEGGRVCMHPRWWGGGGKGG